MSDPVVRRHIASFPAGRADERLPVPRCSRPPHDYYRGEIRKNGLRRRDERPQRLDNNAPRGAGWPVTGHREVLLRPSRTANPGIRNHAGGSFGGAEAGSRCRHAGSDTALYACRRRRRLNPTRPVRPSISLIARRRMIQQNRLVALAHRHAACRPNTDYKPGGLPARGPSRGRHSHGGRGPSCRSNRRRPLPGNPVDGEHAGVITTYYADPAGVRKACVEVIFLGAPGARRAPNFATSPRRQRRPRRRFSGPASRSTCSSLHLTSLFARSSRRSAPASAAPAGRRRSSPGAVDGASADREVAWLPALPGPPGTLLLWSYTSAAAMADVRRSPRTRYQAPEAVGDHARPGRDRSRSKAHGEVRPQIAISLMARSRRRISTVRGSAASAAKIAKSSGLVHSLACSTKWAAVLPRWIVVHRRFEVLAWPPGRPCLLGSAVAPLQLARKARRGQHGGKVGDGPAAGGSARRARPRGRWRAHSPAARTHACAAAAAHLGSRRPPARSRLDVARRSP